MPHLILDYSSNIIEKEHMPGLLKKMNILLSETLPTELLSCKSRSIERDSFCVGDGNSDNAFVHVNLKIMPGRYIEKLNNLGDVVMSTLKEYFHQSVDQLNLQITLEIEELQKAYFKYAA